MEATPATAKPSASKKASPSPRFAPSSPNVRRFFEEKEEMQNLNDRLAVYIDKVRRLENENYELTIEVTKWKEKEGSEVSEVKKMFEAELTNARQLLDDIAKEKSRIELENARNSSLAIELQSKLDEETKFNANAGDKIKILTKKLNDKEAIMANLKSDFESYKDQCEKLKKESVNLQESLNAVRYDLEKRTLEKVDLENRIQTLNEDLDFRKKMYEKELMDLKDQMVSVETSKSYMETDFIQKYDNVMKDKLQGLRDEFEEEAENIKNDIENNYRQKLNDLKDSGNSAKSECERQLIIIRESKACVEALKIDKNVLETELHSMKKRIEELERLRTIEKDDLNKQLEDKRDEVKDLNAKIDQLEQDCEDLMGIKAALDLEISAYRKLLEGEEARLKITPNPTPSPPRRKRARVEVDSPPAPSVISTAKGSIEIADCDGEGKFIKIFNTSTNDEPLGGWIVESKAGDQPSVSFKFNARSVLKGGATVTLWSASSGVKHKPPTDLVMKTSSWAAGSDNVTTIQNSDGEVVAQRTETVQSDAEKYRRKPRRRMEKNESCVIS